MRVSIMTAALSAGDAIGNYCLTLQDVLTELGFQVQLYADSIAPAYRSICQPSVAYRPREPGILWFHYSMYADNFLLVRQNPDYRIMDFHGVSPPHLLAKVNPHLSRLCRRGLELLGSFQDDFDLCVVHSSYSEQVLAEHGYRRFERLPLVVDTRRFDGHEDETLSAWLRKLEYLLFVGRIVPQKGIAELLEVLAHLKVRRPGIKLFLVGGQEQAPAYQRRLGRLVRRLELEDDVLFTGHLVDPAVLTSFYRHARLSVFLSEWESFCVPVVESMYFGTPAVGHHVPPLPETIGEGGMVVDKAHPEAVAARIDEVLSNATEYEALSAAARRRAAAFTHAALRREVAAVLKRLL